MNFLKNQPPVIWLLLAFYWFISFGRAVLPTHLSAQGLSLFQILFGSFLVIVGQIAVVFFLSLRKKDYSVKAAWIVGMIFYATFFFLAGFKIVSVTQYYIGSILAGIGSLIFYLFYNFVYFSEKSSGIYSQSAKFFNILVGVSIIVPIVAGFVGSINFSWVIFITGFFFLVAVFVTLRQRNDHIKINLSESIKKAKGARAVIFLNGMYDSLGAVITIFTLKFIKAPLEFGGFLAYLALVAVLSNLVFSALGDKYKKGHLIVVVVAIISAICVLVLGFNVNNLLNWAIATSLLGFISPLFNSSVLALSLERSSDKIGVLPARELFLNAGRLLVLGWASWLFFIGASAWIIFLLPAISVLLLGFVALKGNAGVRQVV